ncbi:hypothetical protein [Mucilaginibacter segetis]|uniref:PepSY-like beta-lactamase-inhibitor n=1 Tax=Mucilaginibacter segetis TaxID=2793071 RepID=A0A934PUS6_9SPHI|nr:hypothetical protein [Mucilaginibacter segetis]MBK0379475.1 hypothetical protein [Mucilaginibacter segetis]
MKRILLTTAIAALFTANVFAIDGAKKTNGDGSDNVSYAVVNKFKIDFSNATDVTWTVTSNTQKATFTIDGVKKTAFYNLRGEYLGVTQYIDFKDLPFKATKEIMKDYKDYTIGEVIKLESNVTDNTIDPTVYFVDLKNDTEEVLLRVTPASGVYFFKQVK